MPLFVLAFLLLGAIHLMHRYLPGYYLKGTKTLIFHAAIAAGVALASGVPISEIRRRFSRAMQYDVDQLERSGAEKSEIEKESGSERAVKEKRPKTPRMNTPEIAVKNELMAKDSLVPPLKV